MISLPKNLKINFICPTNSIKRRYTLRYDNNTDILNLDISSLYNYKRIDFNLRDEVLGEWILVGKNKYNLCLHIYIKGYYPYEIKRKYEIFKSYLDSIITTILYSDKIFLSENEFLLNSSIIVKFFSSHFMFNSSEFYGLVNKYIKKEALTK
jgi:hypothetical protein